MNQRRLLILALGASLSGNAALLWAQTTRGSMRRVGVLAISSRANEEIGLKPFFDQMHKLGWVVGQNISTAPRVDEVSTRPWQRRGFGYSTSYLS